MNDRDLGNPRDRIHPDEARDDARLEAAALYALDAMEPDEARAMRAEMLGDDALRAEVAELEQVAGALGLTAAPAEPGPALRERVLDAIASGGVESGDVEPGDDADSGTADGGAADGGTADGGTADGGAADTPIAQAGAGWEHEQSGKFIRTADEGRWIRTEIDGIEAKRLFVDVENDRMTLLVRMAPGTTYPPHRHAGDEECYVIRGDIQLGGTTMREGDYQFAGKGTLHEPQSTEHGCELLIVCSMHDELIAS